MNMNMNPQQMLQMIQGGANPQQLIMSYLQNNSTPIGQNLMQLAQKGDTAQIEQIARNVCAQRGVDFDMAFNSFKQQLGIK